MNESRRPVLSACVCTAYGAERIEDTLWSLVCQSAAGECYEILVVDNGVEDRKALEDLVERLSGQGVVLRLVREPKPGLSHAKNRAAQESRGEYVLFLDDDALANPRWVESYRDAVEREHPDVMGGSIHPLFEAPPPDALDYSFWGLWSLKHFGPRPRWLDKGEYFLGGNMGARRSLLLENPHDTKLGRRGEKLVGGEEWYLGHSRFRRLLVPGAYVFHKVPVERFSVDYLRERCRAATPVDSLECRPMRKRGVRIRRLAREVVNLVMRASILYSIHRRPKHSR